MNPTRNSLLSLSENLELLHQPLKVGHIKANIIVKLKSQRLVAVDGTYSVENLKFLYQQLKVGHIRRKFQTAFDPPSRRYEYKMHAHDFQRYGPF